MKIRTRLNLAAMRAAFVVAAIFQWTWDDLSDVGRETLGAIIEVTGNVLGIAFVLVVGPFLKFREAMEIRKRITEETTWTKQRKPSTK